MSEKMLSAVLSYVRNKIYVACVINPFNTSSGSSSSSSTGLLSSHVAVLSAVAIYPAISSRFRENFSILLITIMAERRRSLARWRFSNSWVVKMVKNNEMVVARMIIPSCFQKLPFRELTLILGGLIGSFAIL